MKRFLCSITLIGCLSLTTQAQTTLAPFFDAGTVRDRWQDLDFSNIKTSYGVGARVAWNLSTIVFFDYGLSREDRLFYFGIGQIF